MLSLPVHLNFSCRYYSLYFIAYLFFVSECFSQEKQEVLRYAHQVIDTLCSPSMQGRGYINNGDSIAADFLQEEFARIGIKPLGDSYKQFFQCDVNTFPETSTITIGSKTLQEGKDFIPKEYSSSVSGKFKIKWLDKTTVGSNEAIKELIKNAASLNTQIINKALVVDTAGIDKDVANTLIMFAMNLSPKVLFIVVGTKLTHNVSRTSYKTPSVVVTKNTFSKTDKYVSILLKNKLLLNHTSQNVLGFIKGTQYPDSFILFSAHYDHLGQLGKDVYFPGANDNASGCAMLLNLAKYYAAHPPKYSIGFFAFGGEELGLLGSKFYVNHSIFSLTRIKFLINLDLVGTGDEGIKVVNATVHKTEFDTLVKINSENHLLPDIYARGKAMNSDHYYFEEAGVKTFFIYTLGGIKAYHDIYDRPETLPLTKFYELYNLLTGFTSYLERVN